MSTLELFWQQLYQTSIIEWLTVIFGFAYLVFVTMKNTLAWPCAIVGSSFSVFLCYNGQLYIEMFLSIFYVAMAVWGWYSWTSTSVKSVDSDYKIQRWSSKIHLINLFISSLLALGFGWVFSNYTNQVLPYLDAFITLFSILATFMVTQKVLENWIYWIFIDIASIQLFAYRGYYLVAFQMIVYTLIAIYGFYQWRKDMFAQNSKIHEK